MTATSPPRPSTAQPDDRTPLQRLVDRAEITDLVARLGRSLDRRTFDDLRDLFTSDASVATPGGTAHGHEAIVAQARRRHSTDVGIQHIVTNLLIEQPTADRATVRANLLVSFARTGAADPTPFLLGEVYDLALRRTPAGWRLTALSGTPVWSINQPTA